ncbi:MAG: hypothetical protein EZS28_047859, partial [Streblomastix strix]
MKPIIEIEKMKLKTILPAQYKHYPNKDGPLFFYSPKNYRPTLIPRPNDLDLSEEQDGIAGFINIHFQINQSILDAVIGLIIFAAEQIVQSEIESEDQEQLTNELERIVAEGTDYNEDNDQFEHAIELKHFANGNDGLRENDSWMQFQATVNEQANPDINITKASANTPFHNVNGSDGLGGNGCGTQLQAATNENGHKNHQAIDNTGNESNNKQKNDNRTGGQQQYNHVSNNETQYEQDSVNNKPEEKGSP